MKISMRGDYAIRALVELTHHYGTGPVQSAQIAARQSIPEPYLDQLLTVLRKAGFIRSARGPQGGHELAHLPEDIHLDEVVIALEGSLSPIGCVEEGAGCPRTAGCVQREVWERVAQGTKEILQATSIADLALRERQLVGPARYYI